MFRNGKSELFWPLGMTFEQVQVSRVLLGLVGFGRPRKAEQHLVPSFTGFLLGFTCFSLDPWMRTLKPKKSKPRFIDSSSSKELVTFFFTELYRIFLNCFFFLFSRTSNEIPVVIPRVTGLILGFWDWQRIWNNPKSSNLVRSQETSFPFSFSLSLSLSLSLSVSLFRHSFSRHHSTMDCCAASIEKREKEKENNKKKKVSPPDRQLVIIIEHTRTHTHTLTHTHVRTHTHTLTHPLSRSGFHRERERERERERDGYSALKKRNLVKTSPRTRETETKNCDFLKKKPSTTG